VTERAFLICLCKDQKCLSRGSSYFLRKLDCSKIKLRLLPLALSRKSSRLIFFLASKTLPPTQSAANEFKRRQPPLQSHHAFQHMRCALCFVHPSPTFPNIQPKPPSRHTQESFTFDLQRRASLNHGNTFQRGSGPLLFFRSRHSHQVFLPFIHLKGLTFQQ
jgi:hypothetical protein